LLELVTYRVAPHTNSDDPTRYVPEEDLAAWRGRDPIERLSQQLRSAGGWDDDYERSVLDAIESRLERVLEAALAEPVDPATAFDHLWSSEGIRHRQQREQHARGLIPSDESMP
jgi:pyruvate dehydrogenase E1 component alpha subunit